MKVTFVAHRGFAPDGSTIYYIATDASVKKVADELGVVFVNRTAHNSQVRFIIRPLCIYKWNKGKWSNGLPGKYCIY